MIGLVYYISKRIGENYAPAYAGMSNNISYSEEGGLTDLLDGGFYVLMASKKGKNGKNLKHKYKNGKGTPKKKSLRLSKINLDRNVKDVRELGREANRNNTQNHSRKRGHTASTKL